MMQSFVESDPEGKPYMGLEIMDGIVNIRIFLGYADSASQNVVTICNTLEQTARDLNERHLKYKKGLNNGVRPEEGRIKSSTEPES